MPDRTESWSYKPEDVFIPGTSYQDLVAELDRRLANVEQVRWRFWYEPKVGLATRLRLARDYITGSRTTARLVTLKSVMLFLVVAKLILPLLGIGRFFSVHNPADAVGTLVGAGMLALLVQSSIPKTSLDACHWVAEELQRVRSVQRV